MEKKNAKFTKKRNDHFDELIVTNEPLTSNELNHDLRGLEELKNKQSFPQIAYEKACQLANSITEQFEASKKFTS